MLHILAGTNGIDHIVGLNLIHSRRDDGLLSTLDGYYAVESVVEEARHEWFANHLGTFSDFHHAQL